MVGLALLLVGRLWARGKRERHSLAFAKKFSSRMAREPVFELLRRSSGGVRTILTGRVYRAS